MSRQNFSAKGLTRRLTKRLLFVTLGVLVLIASTINVATAQLKPWDSNNQVMIDLSVLSDNGHGPTPMGTIALPSLTGNILNPPSRMPVSRLLVNRPPVSGVSGARQFQGLPKVTLIKPSKSKQRRRTRRAAKKPRSRAPKKVAAINAPPQKPRTTKSKPATNLAPAPKAQPKPAVKMAAAPPPPPVVKQPAPVAKPEIAVPVAPKPKATAPQIAALPSPGAATDHLIFMQGDAKLTSEAQQSLDGLAAELNANPKARMQLLAYAGEPNLSASKARRLSLSRALSVRSYLIKKGVRSTRIDVRALGKKVPSGAPNRVDLKLIGK